MRFYLALIIVLIAAPLAAKDSLGVFGNWGAFRDADVPRCYAIAAPQQLSGAREFAPFASVGTWPERQVRSQVHFRVSRRMASNATITLRVGGEQFTLSGSGGNAWAANPQQDQAILAAMRNASTMVLNARDVRGNAFSNRYDLEGAATAMDAASVGCSRAR